jgi:hypothetical protein
MARFSTRQLRRSRGTAGGDCKRTRTWDDLRKTPGAEQVIAEMVSPDALELFLRLHWDHLPRVVRKGMTHQSNMRSGSVVYLSVITYCNVKGVQGIVCLPNETSDFEAEVEN